jgi:transposase-like protein
MAGSRWSSNVLHGWHTTELTYRCPLCGNERTESGKWFDERSHFQCESCQGVLLLSDEIKRKLITSSRLQ